MSTMKVQLEKWEKIPKDGTPDWQNLYNYVLGTSSNEAAPNAVLLPQRRARVLDAFGKKKASRGKRKEKVPEQRGHDNNQDHEHDEIADDDLEIDERDLVYLGNPPWKPERLRPIDEMIRDVLERKNKLRSGERRRPGAHAAVAVYDADAQREAVWLQKQSFGGVPEDAERLARAKQAEENLIVVIKRNGLLEPRLVIITDTDRMVAAEHMATIGLEAYKHISPFWSVQWAVIEELFGCPLVQLVPPATQLEYRKRDHKLGRKRNEGYQHMWGERTVNLMTLAALHPFLRRSTRVFQFCLRLVSVIKSNEHRRWHRHWVAKWDSRVLDGFCDYICDRMNPEDANVEARSHAMLVWLRRKLEARRADALQDEGSFATGPAVEAEFILFLLEEAARKPATMLVHRGESWESDTFHEDHLEVLVNALACFSVNRGVGMFNHPHQTAAAYKHARQEAGALKPAVFNQAWKSAFEAQAAVLRELYGRKPDGALREDVPESGGVAAPIEEEADVHDDDSRASSSDTSVDDASMGRGEEDVRVNIEEGVSTHKRKWEDGCV